MPKINIAIDGPAGSGKTTIGNLLAQKLKYQFLDSGLLYRHFA
jgi:cytidylate kinase